MRDAFQRGTYQDNIWRINNWGKGFVDYLQIYLRDLLVSSLRFCLWLRIRSLRKSSNMFFSYLPQSQSTWWDLQSISCFFVALDQILTWCLTRKLEPLCPAEPLPLCRKSENFFPPNFAQASKLLRHSRPKPALVLPTFLLSCIYSIPTLWPTESSTQFSRCFLKKVFL